MQEVKIIVFHFRVADESISPSQSQPLFTRNIFISKHWLFVSFFCVKDIVSNISRWFLLLLMMQRMIFTMLMLRHYFSTFSFHFAITAPMPIDVADFHFHFSMRLLSFSSLDYFLEMPWCRLRFSFLFSAIFQPMASHYAEMFRGRLLCQADVDDIFRHFGHYVAVFHYHFFSIIDARLFHISLWFLDWCVLRRNVRADEDFQIFFAEGISSFHFS